MTTISPLQRFRRDDWVIPCALRDEAGGAVNLTGTVIGGEFWLAGYKVSQPLTVANGGIVRVSDMGGQFTVVVPRQLTSGAVGDAGRASAAVKDRTRVLIYMLDTYGRRQTLGVVPFEVFDGSEVMPIDDLNQVVLVSQTASFQIVVPASQGAPGPSEIGAAQITDGGAMGRRLLKAATAEAVRDLIGVDPFEPKRLEDVNYAAKPADGYVGYATLTAPRTVSLPLAAQYPFGRPFWIADLSGACSEDRRIFAQAAGDDTIAGQPSVFMASAFQKLVFHSNGSNLWTVS